MSTDWLEVENTGKRPGSVPLCVDLDGTLVKSDTLLDTAMALWRQDPFSPLRWPAWVAKGKAALKQELTSRIQLDVEHLPYNQPLLDYLRAEYAAGRRIFLATAADSGLAQRIADHLGIFEGVLASDGRLNLAGGNKLAAFESRFPDGFTYIGNAMPDRKLLGRSVEPMVANPHASLMRALRADNVTPARHFQDRSNPLRAFIKAVRLHQWAKNTLIFVPLLLAHQVTANRVAAALVAFFSISFCASATYIINDLLDIEADRRHPRKSRRAFASGDLSPIAGVAIIAAFAVIAVALALALPHIYSALPGIGGQREVLDTHYPFILWLGLYTVTTLAYSIRLKRMMLVDVFVLSGLYTIRIVAGSSATDVPISTWLAAFSIFFFLSLAFVKRFSELYMLQERNLEKPTGRGYAVQDLEQVRSFGTASGYAAVIVLTMYISSLDTSLYSHGTRLWLLVPVILLWISRVWMITSRGDMHEDPVVYAIVDRRSWLLGALAVLVVWLAL